MQMRLLISVLPMSNMNVNLEQKIIGKRMRERATRLKQSLFLFCPIALVLIVAAACSGEQEEDNTLFLKVENSSVKLPEDPTALAQEIVKVRFNALKQGDKYAANLWIDLFDQGFEATQIRIEQRSPSEYTWCGKAKDGSISNVVLTVGDKIMFGRIEYLGSVYKIEPIEDGVFHCITKVDPTKVMPFGNDALIPQ